MNEPNINSEFFEENQSFVPGKFTKKKGKQSIMASLNFSGQNIGKQTFFNQNKKSNQLGLMKKNKNNLAQLFPNKNMVSISLEKNRDPLFVKREYRSIEKSFFNLKPINFLPNHKQKTKISIKKQIEFFQVIKCLFHLGKASKQRTILIQFLTFRFSVLPEMLKIVF